MEILVTGNMGYIGPVLAQRLRRTRPGARLTGLDTGYFAHCLTGAPALPEHRMHRQYFADVRNPPYEVFTGVDSVIYLSAISNDPMGNTFEAPTGEINADSALNMAALAKEAGAKSFVFASSCSMYGAASDRPRVEEDPLNPLTAYARSKVKAEKGLAGLAGGSFCVTSLRFCTACGMSPRLRLDLVLNDFVAGAVSEKNITILSDGSPWRPLIHVKDMCRAMDWAMDRAPDPGEEFVAVNVGTGDWNHQVIDLARAVADTIGGVKVSVNSNAAPDKRSYKVDFSRFAALAPNHQPQYDLKAAIKDLQQGLEAMRFNNPDFRNSEFMRLMVLKNHIEQGRLDEHLRWID